jgi:circadian clock protein KaiC
MKNSKTSSENPSSRPLKKLKTFITGLDEILEGGLPANRTTVINGMAGTGKSIFGIEFIYRGALNNEPGIFVGFEETAQHIRENALSLGLDIKAVEDQNKFCIVEGQLPTDIFLRGEFSLKGLLAIITGKSEEMGAKRIVIDALDVVLRLFDNPKEVRNEMHLLNNWLRDSGLTIVMTLRPSKTMVSPFQDFFDSLSDCIIQLDSRITNQIATRRIQIVKFRGSGFGRNEYPYVITSEGIQVAPISTVGLNHKALGEHISTGNADLDILLGGGFRRASCTLIAGLPGVGKTILASTYTAASCKRGEKVLYVGFEESVQALIGNVKSAGILLGQFTKNNTLSFLTRFPEEMGAEEHFILLKNQINKFNPQHIIIDAISATQRMGGKQASYEYLMRILNLSKTLGITTLFLNQLSGESGFIEISGIDISSMVDTVLFLSYVEYSGETNRLMNILKSRGNKHSNQKREFVITDNGILFKDIYVGDNQVLTGSARQIQEEKDAAALKLLEFQIQEKELELKRLNLNMEQSFVDQKLRAELRGDVASKKAVKVEIKKSSKNNLNEK